MLADTPQRIVARKTLPAKDLSELIAWLKENPGKATAGTVGVGGPEITGIYFQKTTGTSFQFVPYRGGAPLNQDMLAGHIDFGFGQAASTFVHVRNGNLKAYAVMAKRRWAAAPDVPTIDEAGLPGLYASFWHGLWMPKGTPTEPIARLNSAVQAALADATVRQRFADQGQDVPAREQQTPEALAAQQKAEIEKWCPILKAGNIKGEYLPVLLGSDAVKLPRRTFLHLAAGAAALPAFSRVATAQGYPSRPVRLVVGFAAGSTTDILARLMGQWLSERLGQPVIIENRPGAAGNIAAEAVVKAPADGYTLLMVPPASAINATLYDKLSFNFLSDMAPVAGVVRVPNVVEVSPSVPVKTVPELVDHAKRNPGALSFASAGIGTASHLAGELFKVMTGVNMVHVAYRGDGPAMTDLIGGQV